MVITSSTEVKYSPWIRPLRGLMSLESLKLLVLAIRAKYLNSVLGGSVVPSVIAPMGLLTRAYNTTVVKYNKNIR